MATVAQQQTSASKGNSDYFSFLFWNIRSDLGWKWKDGCVVESCVWFASTRAETKPEIDTPRMRSHANRYRTVNTCMASLRLRTCGSEYGTGLLATAIRPRL